MSDAAPEYVLWPYTPSLVGGAIAAICMAVLTTAHIWRLIKNRTWFCIPFVIGGLFETIGYAARAAANKDTETKIPYIIQSILILLAPILFAASIYMVLGRLIRRTDSASLSIIRPTLVTKIFVAGDVFSFFVQGGGGGMLVQAKSKSDVQRGENIILGGLILQIIIFGFFVVVASIWHKRLSKYGTAASAQISWKKYIMFLYGASALVMIRNTCRVIEYAMGKEGYLLSHEWPLYFYDFLPMFLVLIVCLSFYDHNIKPGKGDNHSDVELGMQRQRTRSTGEGEQKKRTKRHHRSLSRVEGQRVGDEYRHRERRRRSSHGPPFSNGQNRRSSHHEGRRHSSHRRGAEH